MTNLELFGVDPQVMPWSQFGTNGALQGGPKMAQFLYALTSSNINRFSKLFHCQNQAQMVEARPRCLLSICWASVSFR